MTTTKAFQMITFSDYTLKGSTLYRVSAHTGRTFRIATFTDVAAWDRWVTSLLDSKVSPPRPGQVTWHVASHARTKVADLAREAAAEIESAIEDMTDEVIEDVRSSRTTAEERAEILAQLPGRPSKSDFEALSEATGRKANTIRGWYYKARRDARKVTAADDLVSSLRATLRAVNGGCALSDVQVPKVPILRVINGSK